MNFIKRSLRTRVRTTMAFCVALSIFLSISAWQVPAQKDFASDPKNAEKLVGATIGVLSLATGPGAPAALAAAKIMKDMMGALGFFKSEDPVGAAIASINQRLDAANVRMDMIENGIRALNNKVFENANLERIRELRTHRNEIERVMSDLRRKDPNKEGLILRARQTADALLEDKDLWLYSDIAVKDQFMPVFNGTTGLNELKPTNVKAGMLLEPEFTTIPTLEIYASAISAWVAAIEYAGNPTQVNSLYGQNIQRHIDNLSVRPNIDESAAQAQTVPEQLKQQIQGFYTPTTTRPDANLMCNFSEYIEDSFAGETKFVQTYEYRVVAANSLCSVPQGLVKRATGREEELERAYGMEVIDTLAGALTRLKRNGTVREQLICRFDTNFKADDFNILYSVSPDGTLTWHRHVMRYPSKAPTAHSFNPPKVVGSGWADGVRDVMSAGLKGIYSLRNDGDLQWFWHEGFSDGTASFSGGANFVTTKNMQGFYQVIAQDEGVMYGRLHQNDPGIMWGRTANYDNRGMPKTGFGMRLTAQSINFAAFKKIFAGGKGVLYGIGHDGKLYWMKHNRYMNPVPDEWKAMQIMPGGQVQYQQWLTQWNGPLEIMAGVGDAIHAFSPGEGHLYFVLNDGSLAYTRHAAWNTSTGRISNQFLPTIDKPVPIAQGWGSYKFAFARITTSDAGSGIRGLDVIVN